MRVTVPGWGGQVMMYVSAAQVLKRLCHRTAAPCLQWGPSAPSPLVPARVNPKHRTPLLPCCDIINLPACGHACPWHHRHQPPDKERRVRAPALQASPSRLLRLAWSGCHACTPYSAVQYAAGSTGTQGAASGPQGDSHPRRRCGGSSCPLWKVKCPTMAACST